MCCYYNQVVRLYIVKYCAGVQYYFAAIVLDLYSF